MDIFKSKYNITNLKKVVFREENNMKEAIFRKGYVIGIIVCFVGAGVLPSISGNNELKVEINNENTTGHFRMVNL